MDRNPPILPPPERLHQSAKHLKEPPQAQPAQDRNRQVIVPPENIHNLARARHHPAPQPDHPQSHPAAHAPLALARPPQQALSHNRRQGQRAPEHEPLIMPIPGHDPPPEQARGQSAYDGGSRTASDAFSPANARRVAPVDAPHCAGRRVAPAEQQHAHDAHVFGEKAEHHPRPEQVPNHPVPALDLALAHQRA